jgi:hypothetical protein
MSKTTPAMNASTARRLSIQLPCTTPRNPWVAAAFRTGAGSHRRSESAQRQHGRRVVQQQLAELDSRKHPS